jgi:hypothetical protein
MLPDFVEFANDLRVLMLDEDFIQKITKQLMDLSDSVVETNFQKHPIDQTVFGDSSLGGSLGYHHSLAHKKVSDSIAAILLDLKAFGEGFTNFQKTVTDTDQGSAADSKRVTTALETLDRSAGFSHTHQVNHHYHPGGGTHA